MGVQSHEGVDAVLGEGLDDVNLIKSLESFWDHRHRSMRSIVDNRLYFHLSLVGLKFATEHFRVAAERVIGVGTRMHGDKGFARLDQIDESIAIWELQISRGIGKDKTIVAFDLIDGHFIGHVCLHLLIPLGIGCIVGSLGSTVILDALFKGILRFIALLFRRTAWIFRLPLGLVHVIDREGTAFLAELRQHFLRSLNGRVAKAGRDGHDEQFFGSISGGGQDRRGERQQTRQKQNRFQHKTDKNVSALPCPFGNHSAIFGGTTQFQPFA